MHKKRKLPGFTQAPASPRKKCAMKMKETRIRKRRTRKNIIHRRKPFIAPKQETDENDLHEPQGDDCGYNEGTICLVGGLIVGREMVGTQMDTIKLAMAGTQDWWCRFPPLLCC